MNESDYPALEELYPLLKRNALEFIYGKSETGDLLRGDLLRDMPLNLLGDAGKGKTCLAAGVLRQLYEANDAEHLQVVFIDNQQQLAFLFASLPQTGAVATNLGQLGKALALPFEGRTHPPAAVSPYWLIVVDGWRWIQEWDAREGLVWHQFLGLPARFASDPRGVRGGLLVIETWGGVPFSGPVATSAVFARDRSLQGLHTWGLHRGQFLLERRLRACPPEVTGPLLAPWLPATSPRFLVSLCPPLGAGEPAAAPGKNKEGDGDVGGP